MFEDLLKGMESDDQLTGMMTHYPIFMCNRSAREYYAKFNTENSEIYVLMNFIVTPLGMVENVMKQLISKDILYEPMKEMQAKVNLNVYTSRLYLNCLKIKSV